MRPVRQPAGDDSAAGWGFAQEYLQHAAHRATVRGWFEAAQVDAFACSHTCLPVFRALPISTRAQPAWVLNNGATGMPNFRSDGAGLFTRIGLRPFAGPALARRHGLVQDGVHIDAIAVDSTTPEWQAAFLRQWPTGSDVHLSYWSRVVHGPDYGPAQALVLADPCVQGRSSVDNRGWLTAAPATPEHASDASVTFHRTGRGTRRTSRRPCGGGRQRRSAHP